MESFHKVFIPYHTMHSKDNLPYYHNIASSLNRYATDSEYLSPTAHDPVNVDSKVAELVKKRVTGGKPDRYCFEEAEVLWC